MRGTILRDTIKFDAIAPNPGEPSPEVCLAIEDTNKSLGLRPFTVNNGDFAFTEGKLPSKLNFEPTARQLARAKKQQGPLLTANVKYVFYDRCACKGCSEDTINQALALAGVGPVQDDTSSFEFLDYAGIGGGFCAAGRTPTN